MTRKGMDRFTPITGIADIARRAIFAAAGPKSQATGHFVDLRVLELLTARLCHELSGPIAAINNGVELLAEEDLALAVDRPDPAFLQDAVALVGDSARRARSRLQFYRFAYGFSSGSADGGPGAA